MNHKDHDGLGPILLLIGFAILSALVVITIIWVRANWEIVAEGVKDSRERVYMAKAIRTSTVIQDFSHWLRSFYKEKGYVPSDPARLFMGGRAQPMADGWGNPITVEVLKVRGQAVVTLNSAGPDREDGTEDDICYVWTNQSLDASSREKDAFSFTFCRFHFLDKEWQALADTCKDSQLDRFVNSCGSEQAFPDAYYRFKDTLVGQISSLAVSRSKRGHFSYATAEFTVTSDFPEGGDPRNRIRVSIRTHSSSFKIRLQGSTGAVAQSNLEFDMGTLQQDVVFLEFSPSVEGETCTQVEIVTNDPQYSTFRPILCVGQGIAKEGK